MATTTDLMVIQQRLVGWQEVVAGLDAESAAMGKLAVTSDVASKAVEKAGKRGFLLNQVLFTARRGIYGLTQAMVAIGVGMLYMGFQFDSFKQQSTLAFTSLLGNAKMASDEISYLFNVAAKTPFTFQNVTATARQFLAFGFTLKQTNQYLNVLGDTVSAFGLSGDQISHLAVVFGQIHQSGRLLGQDMRQLEQAGIPVFPALRKELGLTQLQIQQFMKGQLVIPSQYGIPAIMKYLQDRFGGMAAIQAKTFAGEASTFKDYLSQLMGNLENSLFNRATHAMGGVNDALTKLNKTLTTKGFGAFLKQLDDMTGSGGRLVFMFGLVKSVLIAAWTEFYRIFKIVRDVTGFLWPLLIPLGLFIKALAFVIKHLGPLNYLLYLYVGWLVLTKIWLVYVTARTIIWTAWLAIYYGVLTAVIVAQKLWAIWLARDTIALAVAEAGGLVPFIISMWGATVATYGLTSALGVLTVALLTNPISLAIIAGLLLLGIFALLMWKVKAFREFMLHYGGFLMLLFPPTAILGAVLLIIGYWNQLKAPFFAVVNFIKSHWQDLIIFLTTGPLGNILYHYWDPLVSGLTSAWNWIKGIFWGAVNWLKGIFGGLWSWIKSQMKDALDPRNALPFGLGGLVGGKGGLKWGDLNPFSWAQGGVQARPGLAIVGERGPELVWLPGSTHVQPMSPIPEVQTQQFQPPGQSGGPSHLTIHVPVQLGADVIANSTAKLMLDQMARA
jgi:tape measure domain-containing protein